MSALPNGRLRHSARDRPRTGSGSPVISRPSRRDLLRAGGLGLFGLTLIEQLRAEAAGSSRPGSASACILLYMHGGPSHLDTLDPKPGAPSGIRGEFASIPTVIPGVRVAEHLQRTARVLRHGALVRSVHHAFSNHNPATQAVLSGRPPGSDNPAIAPGPDDFPAVGSVVARIKPAARALPSFVHLPELANDGPVAPGQFAGFLGQAHQPFVLRGDPTDPDFILPELTLPPDLTERRLEDRRALLRHVDAQAAALEAHAGGTALGPYYERAIDLLTSPAAKDAFDLSGEDPGLRDRYGRNRYGQSVLLARRLIEAGVRFVTVNMGASSLDGWDTHKNNFAELRDRLCPQADRFIAALLADLDERGLLGTTLVVWIGEFGRTPRVGQGIGNNGTDATGRDHWPHCYSVLLAGGGIRGGQVYGASDRIGAYPQDRPVTPGDLAATVFRALGLDPRLLIRDRLGRPLALAEGEPLESLWTGAH